MQIMELYDRALTGRRVEEKEFDLKIFPGKLKELIKKYGIAYDPEEPVPQDLDMAKRAFDAAVELLTEVGVYCRDTKSIITIEKREIEKALGCAPTAYVIGEGSEAVECCCRGIGDKRRPIVIGGPCGAPLSEENFMDIMVSHAKEAIDGVHTGALQTLFGRSVIAGEPVELMACQHEALWAREAVKRTGKPGLSLLGIMSGITSEAQNAGDFPGGLRPCDAHLVCFSNDLKAGWVEFKKVVHNQNRDNIIEACCIPMLGGYSGGPEGTAITAIAEVMQGYVMANPRSFVLNALSIRFGASDRQAIWVDCMSQLAFITAGVNILLSPYVAPTAGPCTEMLCDEAAAVAIAQTASGAYKLMGAIGREAGKLDYTTGMESRILSEISRAAAGVKLDEANEIVKELIGKYEETLRSGKAPVGKSFTECYEQGPKASKKYVNLWEEKKKELEKMGLAF